MSPSKLASWEGLILVGGLFAVVFWKMLTGEIRLNRLMHGDRLDREAPSGFSSGFSPSRGQLLMVTIVTAGYYLIQVIHNPREFPQVPISWVVALGGSHAVYLGGKATAMLLGRLQDLFDRRTP